MLDAFMPHGMCYLWRPELLALHVGSDLLIALAYFSIPAALVVFLRRRPDVEPRWMFWLFTAFILLCGITHLMGMVVVWQPLYFLQGFLKLATALVSVATAIALWPLVPKAIAVPSPAELEIRNRHIEHLNRQLEQRVENLSTLAGGIAHDFNNLLTVVAGNADVLRHDYTDPDVRGTAEAIARAADRAATLCGRMLSFSGHGNFVLEAVDVNTSVRSAVDAVDGHFHVDLAGDLPPMEGTEDQLEVLIRELLRNAVEATTDAGSAEPVSVRTRLVHPDSAPLSSSLVPHRPVAGPMVELQISDSGPGIDEAVRERIVEPYFSTRASGRGLGLAAVSGIVRSHGAALLIDSHTDGPERGTRIQVLFPIATEATQGWRAATAAAGDERGLILVVDDVDEVRHLVRRFLERLGHRVVTAADGAEALALVEQHGDGIGAALVDYSMPEMTGVELTREIRRRSTMDIWLTSGYAQGDFLDHTTRAEFAGFIAKPFVAADLERHFGRRQSPASDGDDARGGATPR